MTAHTDRSARVLGRRSLLKGATALAAAAVPALGATVSPRAYAGDDANSHDVIVIGAGFAGVAAARDLAAAGHSTLLLEARDRIGGRVWTTTFAGEQVEMGGTWIDQRQPFVWQEAQRHNLRIIADAPPDRAIFPTPGGFTNFAAAEAFARHAELITPMFDGAQEYYPRPYEPYFREDLITRLDRLSVQDRVDQLGYSAEDRLFISQFAGGLTGSARTIALTETAHWWALGGYTYEGLAGVNTFRPEVGSTGLLRAMLVGSTVTVRLNTPVHAVINNGWSVTVVSRAGVAYRGRAVVVAVPANLWNSIAFTPALPNEFSTTARRGIGVRGAQKFWMHVRGAELTRFYAEAPAGAPVHAVFPHKETSDGNIMIGFSSIASFDPKDRLALQTEMRRFVPDIEVVAVKAQHWGRDPFSAGGWGVRAPGVLAGPMRTLQQPLGRMAFATSDIALGWAGYIDGAIESGVRAADHIAGLLRTGSALTA